MTYTKFCALDTEPATIPFLQISMLHFFTKASNLWLILEIFNKTSLRDKPGTTSIFMDKTTGRYRY